MVLIVAAWNYPLLIVVNSLVPALLSGNAVLLKHGDGNPRVIHDLKCHLRLRTLLTMGPGRKPAAEKQQ